MIKSDLNPEEKEPNFFKKIWIKHKERVSKKDRVEGQTATIVAGACETVYLSGLVDAYPKIQLACHLGALIFGSIATVKAVKKTK